VKKINVLVKKSVKKVKNVNGFGGKSEYLDTSVKEK